MNIGAVFLPFEKYAFTRRQCLPVFVTIRGCGVSGPVEVRRNRRPDRFVDFIGRGPDILELNSISTTIDAKGVCGHVTREITR